MTPEHSLNLSEHDYQWRKILEERPSLGKLQTGLHVRNQQELNDTWDFIDEFSAKYYQPEYIGIVGSRKAEKIYWREAKLVERWGHVICQDSLAHLYKNILIPGVNFDGRKTPPIPEFDQKDADSLPSLNEFYYDIDIVFVQNNERRPLNVKRRIGKRSGTLIEIYSIASRILIDNTYPELQEYFYNSLRIIR